MASAGLLNRAVKLQSHCVSTISADGWQPKMLLQSSALPGRSQSQASVDFGCLRSSFAMRSWELGLGSRKTSGLRSETKGRSSRLVLTTSVQRLPVRAASREMVGSVLQGKGLRFAVVVARFNEIITKPLLAGALETFHKYAVREEDVDVIWVPGSFEIPVVAQQLAKSGKYEAILAIGAVIRGATTHYDAVAGSAASGLMSASLNSGIPVIFGILTTENMDQAIDRAGGKLGNKGAETALTAIEMASLFKYHVDPILAQDPSLG